MHFTSCSSLNLIEPQYLDQIKFNKRPDSQYVMHNILDITKNFEKLPKEFGLFMQHVNLKTQTFEYEFNPKAFPVIALENQQEIMQKYKQRFLNVINNTQCKNFQELLIDTSKKWHQENEKCLDDDI